MLGICRWFSRFLAYFSDGERAKLFNCCSTRNQTFFMMNQPSGWKSYTILRFHMAPRDCVNRWNQQGKRFWFCVNDHFFFFFFNRAVTNDLLSIPFICVLNENLSGACRWVQICMSDSDGDSLKFYPNMVWINIIYGPQTKPIGPFRGWMVQ